jgi:hypothetical protein
MCVLISGQAHGSSAGGVVRQRNYRPTSGLTFRVAALMTSQ